MRPRMLGVVGLLAVALALAGGEAWPQQRPTFRAATDIVAVDALVVSARDGTPVLSLHPADFAVTVDDKPRRVISVDLIRFGVVSGQPGGRPPRTRDASAGGPALPAGSPGTGGDYVVPARRFVLVVDSGNISRASARAAVTAASAFVDRLSPEDLVAVAVLPAGASVDFTTDRRRVRDTLGKIAGGGNEMYGASRTVSLAEAYALVTGRDRRLWDAAVQEECRWARSATEYSSCMAELEANARVLVGAARAAAQSSAQALTRLVTRLGAVEGPKHVVLIGESLVTGTSFGSTDGLGDLAPLAELTQRSRVNLYVLHLDRAFLQSLDVSKPRPSRTPLEDVHLLNDGLAEVAGITGGAYLKLMTAADPAFDRIARETSASYIVGIETDAADRDGKAHRIDVRVNRPGTEVRARKQFVAGRAAASLPAAARPASSVAAAPSVPTERRDAATPEGEALAAKASAYVAGYLGALSGVVCEERYHQRMDTETVMEDVLRLPRSETVTQERDLVSDFLLVRLTGARQFLAFRDVYEVNGHGVRDREDRLTKLFIEPTGNLMQQVERIRQESSRYNIGAAVRDTNVPTFALQFLLPEVRRRFAFTDKGSERVGQVDARVFAYQEIARPTLITGVNDEDVPASGQFWIDPADGTILKSRLDTRSGRKTARIEVTFARDAKVGLVLPLEMVERHEADPERVSGKAVYGNFRQFTVNTTEAIK